MNNNETPRPLNLGEILDRTVQMYRDRFLVYLGIAIIPTGVLLIFGGGIFLGFAWFGAGTRNGTLLFNMPATSFLAMLFVVLMALVALPVMLGVSSLSVAAINHAVAAALAGRRATIRGSFAEAWRRGWQYVWLYFLQALIVWGAPLIVWFGTFALLTAMVAISHGAANPATGAMVGLMTLFGFMAVAGYALWMLLCTALAFPGCVMEKMSAWKAIRRSFRLSKGTRGRIFVLYLLGYVLGSIGSMVAAFILLIGVALIPGMNSPQKAQTMGMAMIFLFYGSSFALQAFTKPVYAIALMLFYYDQRIRNEGFDIEWMMERAGLTAGDMAGRSSEPNAGRNGEPGPGQSVEPEAVHSLEWSAEPSGDATAARSVESPLKLVTMQSGFEGEASGASHAGAAEQATETTEQSAAIEAVEITEATQPENGVQG